MNLPCPCGKQLRVSESHAGRTVRCPGCGTPHVVRPGTTTAPGRPAVKPALPATALPTLLRAAAILLLVFGSGVAGWWALRPAGAAGDEAGLLPDDAELIGLARPAELWAVPEVREAFGEGPGSAVVRFAGWTGIRPEQVERLALVAYRPAQRRVWAVVRTAEPYDATHFERLAGPRRGAFAREGYVVALTPDDNRVAFAPVGPRLLVMGDEESVKVALGLRGRRVRPGGPLAGLEAAAKGHPLAVGLYPSDGWRDEAGAVPGADALRAVRGGTLLLEVAARTKVTLTAEVPDADQRERALKTVQKVQALAALGALGGDPLLELFGAAEADAAGDGVRLRAEGETGPLARALAGWAKKAGW
ncbi:MAG: hypothetical protein ACRC33_01155 [Gemmataceae bacterium]